MTQLPETGFVRLWQILGNPKASPPIPPLIPIAASTWWSGCASGKYPRPIRLSRGITVWRAEEIRELIVAIASRDELLTGERRADPGSMILKRNPPTHSISWQQNQSPRL